MISWAKTLRWSCLLTTQQVEEYLCIEGRQIHDQYKCSLYISATVEYPTLTLNTWDIINKTYSTYSLASIPAVSHLTWRHPTTSLFFLGIILLCNTDKHSWHKKTQTSGHQVSCGNLGPMFNNHPRFSHTVAMVTGGAPRVLAYSAVFRQPWSAGGSAWRRNYKQKPESPVSHR